MFKLTNQPWSGLVTSDQSQLRKWRLVHPYCWKWREEEKGILLEINIYAVIQMYWKVLELKPKNKHHLTSASANSQFWEAKQTITNIFNILLIFPLWYVHMSVCLTMVLYWSLLRKPLVFNFKSTSRIAKIVCLSLCQLLYIKSKYFDKNREKIFQFRA